MATSSSSSDEESTGLNFLELSREIRDLIYELAFAERSPPPLNQHTKSTLIRTCLSYFNPSFKNLRLVNRQVSSEVSQRFYESQPFLFYLDDPSDKICGSKGTCACDKSISAARDILLMAGMTGGPYFSIKLQKKDGKWQATCKWSDTRGYLQSLALGNKFERYKELTDPDLEEYCGKIEGGMSSDNFEAIRGLLRGHIKETGIQPFLWMYTREFEKRHGVSYRRVFNGHRRYKG